MDQRTNYLSLILLDALEDENESDIYFILERNSKAIDPSYVPQDRGIAPLHYVCGMQNKQLAIDVANSFLKMGANPNCRSEDNMTPLHVAAMYGRVEIVSLLLQYGAELEVYDDDRKTPVLYAIEECHFEVVQAMKDHIFLEKYAKKKENNSLLPSESRFESSLQQRVVNNKTDSSSRAQSTPNKTDCLLAKNRNLLKVTNDLDELHGKGDINKFTPNRINYNYDVTSPYYINITHRRHKAQPKFPEYISEEYKEMQENKSIEKNVNVEDVLSMSMEKFDSFSEPTQTVNIFSLTQENLKELTQLTSCNDKSPLSLIEIWREKVQKSRARQSIIKQYDDIIEMIDEVVENDHLNFTNTELKEKSLKEIEPQPNTEVDSGACGSTSCSLIDNNEYNNVPRNNEISKPIDFQESISPAKPQMSLSQLLQTVSEAKVQDFEQNSPKFPKTHLPQQTDELDSSYQTVPEIVIASPSDEQLQPQKTTSNKTRNEYFLQMTEAYVHTDDENGLVFYETKLLSNAANKQAQQGKHCESKAVCRDLDSTLTSQFTALPTDYETDTLRAELTTFGDPPGPITKTTKRMYIRRLIKYKRNGAMMLESKNQNKQNGAKFSVELLKTLKSEENYQGIKDYAKYDEQLTQYFYARQDGKKMREGRLKLSFIYILMDPRISCNLPGERNFTKDFDIWPRFLKSIFYVGKGKATRPYFHLYDAMKTYSRLHNKELQEKSEQGKKIPINVDIFKSPPIKSSDNKKLDRILDIWGNGYGVVSLQVFHNITPEDAYTREAAIIDALSLQHLTNCKRGDYYGPAKTWTMKVKKYLGIVLLFKAMLIHLAEGESQISPSDLI